MQQYVIKAHESGQTLEKYIRKVYFFLPLSFIYKLFRKKDIKVNGHWQDIKYLVQEDDHISVYLADEIYNSFQSEKNIEPSNALTPLIIYEDDNLLIVNKPKGVLVQSDGQSFQKSLDYQVLEYLTYKGEYDSNTDLGFKPGPVHRLDRNTSGLVIFGKNIRTLQYFFDILKNHEKIEKHYYTLVVGQIDKDGEINVPLKKDDENNYVSVDSLKHGAKTAKTMYHVVKNFHNYTLLDVNIITGRTHQIRVHMNFITHPVVGDAKYGDFETNKYFEKTFHIKSQFLHAYKLVFHDLEAPYDYLNGKVIEAPLLEEYSYILSKL